MVDNGTGLLSFYGNFNCLQLRGSIVSGTKVWKNRRLANFRAQDSKYSLTTRCWQYHNSRGGVREMSIRTKTILPGVRKGNFVTWSVGCRSYFFSSRKPALKELGFVFLDTNGKAQNNYKQNPVIGKETQKLSEVISLFSGLYN